MKSLTINGTKRTTLTKQDTKQLRNEGKVPCVIYNGEQNVHFTAPALNFKNLVYSPNVYTVHLDVDGTAYDAVMREIQFHPVTDKILHIDFQQIFPDKEVVMEVPVKINGTAAGVREGGRMLVKLRKLKIKALPAKLPDAFEINVEPLNIGQNIRVGDMKMDGVTFLEASNNIIVGVRVTREVVEETPVAAAAAPGAAPAAGAAAPAAAGAAPGAPAKAAEPAKPAK